MRKLALIAVLVAACGDDEPPPPPPKPGAPGAPAAGQPGGKDDKNKRQARKHIEDDIDCTPPEKPDGIECKPDASVCEQGRYCLEVTQGQFFCEPCRERDTIRRDFRERDFVAEQSRD